MLLLLRPYHFFIEGEERRSDPRLGFQITRPQEIEKKKKVRAKSRPGKTEQRVIPEEYSNELQAKIIDFQEISKTLDIYEKKIQLLEKAEKLKELERMLAQQAFLELQRKALAELILQMEEEEHVLIMMLMDD